MFHFDFFRPTRADYNASSAASKNEYEHCELTAAYSRAALGGGGHGLKIDPNHPLDKQIDGVDPGVTGRLRVERLHDLAPECCKDAVKLALPLNRGGVPFSSLMASVEKDIAAAIKRKGIPRKSVDPDVRKALRWLNESSRSSPKAEDGLFETLAEHNARRKKQGLPAIERDMCLDVGAFFVEKSSALLRVIIDARLTNALVEPKPFSYFALDDLIAAVSNLSKHQTWYAVNVDLRHWFHQIPMPDHLRPCFAVNVSSARDLAGASDSEVLLCRGHPMGYACSPYVAEACTLGMMLHAGNPIRAGQPLNLSHLLDIDPKILDQLNRPGAPLPTWIPFKSGGGLFVMLDNVLVVTPQRATADKWVLRIKGIAGEFNALFKNADTTLRRITLTRGSTESFEFMGVRWAHSSRQVLPLGETEMTLLDTLVPGQPWQTTHRHLARVLGLILWFERVAGEPLCYPASEGLMRLYSLATPAADATWDSALTIQNADVLLQYWKRRLGNETFDAVPRTWNPNKPICYFAVDASETHCAVVQIDRSSGAICDATAIERSDSSGAEIGINSDDIIALAEARAIAMALEAAAQQHPDGCLVVLATDSLTAKAWFEKWYARNPRACLLLRQLHERMGLNFRIALVYVPTDDNVADEPSRGKPCEDGKRAKTLLLLRETECRAQDALKDPFSLVMTSRERAPESTTSV